MPVAGALSSAKDAKVEVGGYALAIAIGLALGLGCAWLMRRVGKKVLVRTEQYPQSHREWIAVGLALGALVASAALRFVPLLNGVHGP